MNVKYVPRNNEMDRIAEAFSGYVHRHPGLDLIWSEKMGYVLLSIDPMMQSFLCGTSVYTNPQKLAYRLFEEVATDVMHEYGDCKVIAALNAEEKEEVQQRWAPFLEMMPEYKSVSEDVLNGNNDSYIDFHFESY